MAVAGRSISMFSLIADDILEPGDEVLTFDYLGKRYIADLLPEGTIRGERQIFASPYAWASHCKNQINPDQKTAIGWGHIRYKGIKLSQYKNLYLKKNKLVLEDDMTDKMKSFVPSGSKKGKGKKVGADMHLSPDTPSHSDAKKTTGELLSNPNITQATQSRDTSHQAALSETSELVQTVSFEAIGEKQPFHLIMSSNVLLLMDYHSHLCWSEMLGYLGGRYDPVQHVIQVIQAFPVYYNSKEIEEECTSIEQSIKERMKSLGLHVVGWYHSHPSSEATPSINDITQQLMYQESIQTKEGDEPCIGFIIGPNLANRRSEIQSKIATFWVKRRDQIHVSPLTVSYSIAWEQFLTQDVVDEMNKLSSFYCHRQDSINFKAHWRDGIPFVHKLKTSLANVQPKFPQESSDETFFTFIEQLVFQTQ